MSERRESPIFVRAQQLLEWLLTATRKFPRDQRFGLAQRLLDQAFLLEDRLVAASVDRAGTAQHLTAADCALTGLRRTIALSHELGWLSDGQFRHASELTAEVGKLLGGWKKAVP